MQNDRLISKSVSVDRRAFFKAAAAATALTAAGGRLASPVLASPPIKRNGKPHMKLSLAAYSFRKYLAEEKPPTMLLDDFIRLCADLDLDGTELTSYYFPKDFDEDYLIRIKQLTFKMGLDISGTAIANDFCLPPGEARDKTLAHTRKWIDYAALMGAPVIRIFAGNVPAGDSSRRRSTAVPPESTNRSTTPPRKESFWPLRTTAESQLPPHRC